MVQVNPRLLLLTLLWEFSRRCKSSKRSSYACEAPRNRPAHILMQYAKGVDHYVTWIKENSGMLESVLAHDMLNFFSS